MFDMFIIATAIIFVAALFLYSLRKFLAINNHQTIQIHVPGYLNLSISVREGLHKIFTDMKIDHMVEYVDERNSAMILVCREDFKTFSYQSMNSQFVFYIPLKDNEWTNEYDKGIKEAFSEIFRYM